jgi:acyl-CoA thioesterase FadM
MIERTIICVNMKLSCDGRFCLAEATPYEVNVPFGHCDIAGIVYTPRVSEYCMEAAEQFLKQEVGLDWAQINREGLFSNPVMRLAVDFKQSMQIGDRLQLSVIVERLGRSSFTLQITGSRSDEGCFTAELVLAIVDLKAAQSIPIPAQFRERLQQFVQN